MLRSALVTSAAVAIGFSVLGAPTASAASTPQRIGVAPNVPQGAASIAGPALTAPLSLSVTLSPRNAGALNAFVSAVSTPGSPEYHHFLSKGEFAAEFGPTQATIDAVRSALTAAGLTPGTTSADGLSIPVRTTVGAAGKALSTGFAGYRLSNGHTAYANTAAPQLPASVAGSITGIVGLNNFVAQTANHSNATRGTSASVVTNATRNSSAPPAVCSNIKTALASNGYVDQQNYWEPGTLSQSYAYNTAPLYGNYGNTGAGVTVGIFELENYSPDDITAYQACVGTNVPVSAIKVDGGSVVPVDYTDQTGLESALDIETVLGLAPGASIKVYQGPDAYNPATQSGATDAQVLDTYRQMVTDDSAQVLSTSWGSCELDVQASDPGFFASENTVFAEAAAQGQSVVAASGDTGSTGCFQNLNSSFRSSLSADDPATQPYVTAVGGTRMTGGTSTAAATETVWNTVATSTAHGAASGGGVSAVQSLSGTGNYQSGVVGAGYSNACNAATGATCRQVPDVSAVADPATGYLITWIVDDQTNGGWYIIGGTSGAAPLWAAIAALADSSTACAANGNAGFLNPALYAHTASLKDVTSGNNDVADSGYTGGLYAAGTGYDMATGLGTPKAPQLVESLCGTKAAGAGSTFVPTDPTRILDTRAPVGVSTKAPVGPNSSIKLQVTGAGGGAVPVSGATAVTLNVTVADATMASYLTVYPDGTQKPSSSNLNFVAGQVIPNQVTVPLGSDGAVDIYNFQGSTDVIADVFGYYTSNSGSRYVPMSPTRVLDTRAPIGVTTKAPIGANSSISLQITGQNGVPASNVTTAVLNVTAVNPTMAGYLTVYPEGASSRPLSSNLNFAAGQVIPNLVTVKVGADGAIDFYNFQGNTDVVADLLGYYTSDQTAGYVFHPSAPHRLTDTRSGVGVAAGQATPVGANSSYALPVSDTNGPGNAGPLATAAGLMLNVTVTAPSMSGYVTVYPSGVSPRPVASNLNFVAGETIPNAVSTPVNGSSIDFYNFQGTVQLVVDLFGYFATS